MARSRSFSEARSQLLSDDVSLSGDVTTTLVHPPIPRPSWTAIPYTPSSPVPIPKEWESSSDDSTPPTEVLVREVPRKRKLECSEELSGEVLPIGEDDEGSSAFEVSDSDDRAFIDNTEYPPLAPRKRAKLDRPPRLAHTSSGALEPFSLSLEGFSSSEQAQRIPDEPILPPAEHQILFKAPAPPPTEAEIGVEFVTAANSDPQWNGKLPSPIAHRTRSKQCLHSEYLSFRDPIDRVVKIVCLDCHDFI